MQVNKVVTDLDTKNYNAVIKQFNDKHTKAQEDLYNECIKLNKLTQSLLQSYVSLMSSYQALYAKVVKDI